MIRLTLPTQPDFLTDDFIEERTAQFKANSQKRVWDIPALKDILLTASHGKCAFSEIRLNEEGKYMQVEHFYPKSKYPDKVLEWGNLLPCANFCNASKRDHDPNKHPLVNPFFDDPKDYFFIENGRLWPIESNNDKATETLKRYDLNNPSQLRLPRYRCQEEIKRTLQRIHSITEKDRALSINWLKSFMTDSGRTSAYSATKSTAILSDETFIKLKTSLIERGEWDDEFQTLEQELMFCSLPKRNSIK